MTIEELNKKLNDKHKGKVIYISGETTTRGIATFKCTKCGNVWSSVVKKVLASHKGCELCWEDPNILPLDEFLERLYKTNNKVEYVGGYTKYTSHVTFRCKKCGNIWDTLPNSVLNNHGCPKCGASHRQEQVKSREPEFLEELEKKFPNKFLYNGGFVNYKTPISLTCKDCGTTFNTTPSQVLTTKFGCRTCSFIERRLDYEKIKDEIDTMYNGSICMTEEYVGKSTKYKFHCNICGREWDSYVSNILKGYGCKECSDGNKLTLDKFLVRLNETHGDTISYVGGYVKSGDRVTLKCNRCGNTWNPKANYVINSGKGCPICNRSHGEKRISIWLDNNLGKDSYITNKTFNGLLGTGGGKLSYDFYIPSLNTCIEFQGEQHYRPVMFTGLKDANKKYAKQIEHDRRKRKYCVDNNILLLEIRYDELDMIESILQDFLIK